MKKLILLCTLICASFLTVTAQLTLSATTGVAMKGGTIGYQVVPKCNVYLGLNYMSGSSTIIETYREVEGNNVYNYENEEELNFKLFIPTLGIKYFLFTKNKVKAYATANYSIPMLFAEAINDGDSDEEVDELSDNNSASGIELGFGGEYFFDNNFSVGVEVGYNRMALSSQSKRSGTYPTTPIITWEEDDSYDFSLSRIYNRFTVNFYF